MTLSFAHFSALPMPLVEGHDDIYGSNLNIIEEYIWLNY